MKERWFYPNALFHVSILSALLLLFPLLRFHPQIQDPVLGLHKEILPFVHDPNRFPPVFRSAFFPDKILEVSHVSVLDILLGQDQKLSLIHI